MSAAFSIGTPSACLLRDGFVVGDYVAIANCLTRLRLPFAVQNHRRFCTVLFLSSFLKVFGRFSVRPPFQLNRLRLPLSLRLPSTDVQDPAFSTLSPSEAICSRGRMPTPTIRHSGCASLRQSVESLLLPSWATSSHDQPHRSSASRKSPGDEFLALHD